MKISIRYPLALALLLLGGAALASCGRSAPDPKEEGTGMPIEIVEERPVDAPGTAEADPRFP